LSGSDRPYRILFVCTANICRSPTAEAVARHRFGEQAVMFRSAGFLASGQACPATLLQALDEVGVDASQHRSYRLDEPSLRASDLVLTMEGEHVQRATFLHRDAFPRILPLKEAAQHMARIPDLRVSLEQFIDEVNRSRDPTAYLSTRWDVEDPYRRKLKHYRQAVEEISGLVESVVGRLAG
jgi:protein-tyrosine-phosphatase